MKKLFMVLFVSLLMIPLFTYAESVNYTSMNLDEALTQEGIEHDFSNYRENDKQVVIYLFRGNGCGFCRNFLTFLNSIVDEYGEYFRVASYEVWYDDNNAALAEDVASFMGDNLSGVPYIVIGDKTFPGFVNELEEDIKNAIMDEYNKKDRYDVFEAMEKARKEEEKAKKKGEVNYVLLISCNLLIVLSATLIIIGYVNNKFNLVMKAIEENKN